MLLREAAKEYNWNLNYGGIALMWRGGCIIRSVFLGKIKEAFDTNPELANLLLDPFFQEVIERLPGRGAGRWPRRQARHPHPALSSGAVLLRRVPHARGCRPTSCRPSATTSAPTPTNGSTSPRGQFFHTNWTGQGMDVSPDCTTPEGPRQ